MPKFTSGQIITADYLNAFDVKTGQQEPASVLQPTGNDERVYIHVDGRIFVEYNNVWVEQVGKDPDANIPGLRSLGEGNDQATSGKHIHDIAELEDEHLHEQDGLTIPASQEWSISWSNFNTDKSMLVLTGVHWRFAKFSAAVLGSDLGFILTAMYGDQEVFSDGVEVFTNAEPVDQTLYRSAVLASVGTIESPERSGQINFSVEVGAGLGGSLRAVTMKLCETSTA